VRQTSTHIINKWRGREGGERERETPCLSLLLGSQVLKGVTLMNIEKVIVNIHFMIVFTFFIGKPIASIVLLMNNPSNSIISFCYISLDTYIVLFP
jgi:hypothetical protein